MFAFSSEVAHSSLPPRFSYSDNPLFCKCHLVKPWATWLTSITGCLYPPCLPREGVFFQYDLYKCVCRQVFVSEEAGGGENAPLPCQPCWWGYGSLCFPGDTAVGRAASNLLGTTCKILCFSSGAALSELSCSRCGKGRQGGKSWKADPRETSEGWHASSGRGVRGTESKLLMSRFGSSFDSPQVWHRQSGRHGCGHFAAVEALPGQWQGLPFSPSLWLQPLPVLQANWRHSSTSGVIALPSPRWM